jgi:Tfp pilus assembly protein PilO
MGLLHALDDMGHAPGVGRRASDAADAPDQATRTSTAPDEQSEPASERDGSGNGGAGALGGIGQRVVGLVRGASSCRGRRGRWSVWRVMAIAILTYVVAVNLSYFFVLKPIWSQLDGLVSKKSVIQDFLVVRQSAAAVSEFRDALMRGDQRVTVVSEIEELADDAGMRIVGEAELGPTKELTNHMLEYPIGIRLEGEYHELGKFLAMVEESPRALITKSVEIETDEEDPDRQVARVELGVASWED